MLVRVERRISPELRSEVYNYGFGGYDEGLFALGAIGVVKTLDSDRSGKVIFHGLQYSSNAVEGLRSGVVQRIQALNDRKLATYLGQQRSEMLMQILERASSSTMFNTVSLLEYQNMLGSVVGAAYLRNTILDAEDTARSALDQLRKRNHPNLPSRVEVREADKTSSPNRYVVVVKAPLKRPTKSRELFAK